MGFLDGDAAARRQAAALRAVNLGQVSISA